MLVHQLLMSPVFGIGTPDSVAVETMKNDYERLRGIENRTDDEQSRFEALEEALRDLARLERRPRARRAARLASRRHQGSAREAAMTKIERLRTAAAIPPAFRGTGRVAKSLELIQGRAAGTLEFNSNVWKAAKPQLKLETGGKCAYCESPTDTRRARRRRALPAEEQILVARLLLRQLRVRLPDLQSGAQGRRVSRPRDDRHVDRPRAARRRRLLRRSRRSLSR